jgi:hypothetical protein
VGVVVSEQEMGQLLKRVRSSPPFIFVQMFRVRIFKDDFYIGIFPNSASYSSGFQKPSREAFSSSQSLL